ncbi:RimK family alpha-L-glutamate ligase [Spongiimicrobium sp. 3-5]|uniref:ATP-grasp domain-containing protein n=1 Tax=Spongiimicrobium sp. 3-5 TaxID=3332596 RepID=UPI00398031CE
MDKGNDQTTSKSTNGLRLGIVTCSTVPNLTESEQALIPLFATQEIIADALVWNDASIVWKDYDYLIIRSLWDYHLHLKDFLKWLEDLENYGVKTLNALPLLKSNAHKFYLKELEKQGFTIVPTIFHEKTKPLDLSSLQGSGWKKAVIKPAVSASAFLTEKFEVGNFDNIEKKFNGLAHGRDLLIQKFMPQIQSFGELSIIFFNRKYSHTVLKTAVPNEFRIQSEFGGVAHGYEPNASIIETAAHILSAFEGDILYARVDGLVHDGNFILMELELIEPELFFDHKKGALERFVEATLEIITSKT